MTLQILLKAMEMFCFCKLQKAIAMNCQQITKAITTTHNLKRSTHKAWPCIAFAIAMQRTSLLRSKCKTFCKLERARAKKLANSQDANKTICRLANATTKNLQPARANHIMMPPASCKSNCNTALAMSHKYQKRIVKCDQNLPLQAVKDEHDVASDLQQEITMNAAMFLEQS